MALEDAFNDLRSNLYKPLIFFIPKSLIPESKKEWLESPEFAQLFNKVALIEKSGEINELKSCPGLFQIMEKPSILNGNIFLLSDQKAALNSFQFNLLMEKYLEQLRFYNTIAKWMALHIAEHCEIDDNIKSYFELQDDFFLNHSQEIEAKFKIDTTTLTKPMDVLEHVEKDLSPFEKLIENNKSQNGITKLGRQMGQTKTRKTKPVLVTNQEAEDFLLKSVFNVLD